MSHYGQPVWVVEEEDVESGPAVWQQGKDKVAIDILCKRGGWLICKQPDGLLCGILWSDGSYYANLLENPDGDPLSELIDSAMVRGTVCFDRENPEDLGAILC